MTPQEKAQELVAKFKDYVPGYIGSSMLINHEYPEQILLNSKRLSKEIIDEIIKTDALIDEEVYVETPSYLQYWLEVKAWIDEAV